MARFPPDDGVRAPRPWLGLGRLLPRTLRTRVFEPAYYDRLNAFLVRHGTRASPGRRVLFGLRTLLSVLDAGRVGTLTAILATPARRLRLAVLLAMMLLALGGMILVQSAEYGEAAAAVGP